MFCVPASFIVGVIGIFVDRSKGLSIATTLVAGLLLLVFFLPFLAMVFCA